MHCKRLKKLSLFSNLGSRGHAPRPSVRVLKPNLARIHKGPGIAQGVISLEASKGVKEEMELDLLGVEFLEG